ncbi:MAG TPA: preprotein translocase subunit Sec61beta [Candidatus Nanoarchaeia archaeon]|nr:preprotein translocase subunit Sec61beta [Candidatus Nanoarchaeia archaeon]
MADNKISMPGSFGGLLRFDEEYKSRFMLSPVHVLVYIFLIILFVVVLKVIWPVSA